MIHLPCFICGAWYWLELDEETVLGAGCCPDPLCRWTHGSRGYEKGCIAFDACEGVPYSAVVSTWPLSSMRMTHLRRRPVLKGASRRPPVGSGLQLTG